MKETSIKYQVLATLSVNLISISYGNSAGWTSSNYILLNSEENTPLECGALSTEQLSWIGSLLGVGGLVGSLFFGWLADKIGRKYCLCLISIPSMISWLLILFAKNAMYLYISRICCGFSAGGSFVLVPLFVSEICEDKIRGTLGSILMVSANLGILLAFIAGHFLSFHLIPIIFIFLPTLFLLTVLIFPDTPFYYIKNNNEEKAIKSLEFYRNIKFPSDGELLLPSPVVDELEKLKAMAPSNTTDNNNAEKVTLADFTNRAARKAMVIGFFLMFLHEFSGIFTMINYTATIFAESGSQIPPNISAIIVGAIQLVGTFVSTRLVDRQGRKFLLLLSSIGSGLSLLILGTYSYLNVLGIAVHTYSWIAVVSFSSMLFLASCGIIPLPFVVISEIMPEKIRSIGATMCLCFSWIMVFGMVKVFPSVVSLVGMHGCIFIFSFCCFCGAIFVVFVLPETKGKSYEQILKDLDK